MQLGDAGAEVIKIEPPAGDFARRMGPPFIGDESAVFLSLNRNKKSVVLDLETSTGREAAARLARDADVVVEDFGPGAARRHRPRLRATSRRKSQTRSIARLAPFGEDGPLRDLPGLRTGRAGDGGVHRVAGANRRSSGARRRRRREPQHRNFRGAGDPRRAVSSDSEPAKVSALR